ncbi:MAG: UbiA prenyltransferase family protein [Rickettsiales bacterium]|nr:UbiA prenyltransferase family protein [Rickettsiales bacterium]
MRAELEATRTQAEIAKAKAAAVVEAKKAAEVRANAAQAAAEVDREKYLARREDQTKAAGSNVSRVNDARNIWSNDYGRTYWRDYNPRLDKSSKDYWKDYVTREIEDNQTAINDSKLIKNTVVPAAAIGSVGVFIAAAATNFLPIMLSIAAMLLAIATFVFKDCKDEIDYRKDSIKELRGQKVGGFTDAILSESKTSLNHPIR